jgi:cytochrome c-type protein NapB
MKLYPRLLVAAGFIVLLAFPVLSLAEEPENYSADAKLTGGDPPTIPHAVKDDATGESCNACHRKGVKEAPPTSHPERLGCTQCHVQGEVKGKMISKKSNSKK